MPPLRSPKPNKNTADYINRRTELQQQQKKGENRKTNYIAHPIKCTWAFKHSLFSQGAYVSETKHSSNTVC